MVARWSPGAVNSVPLIPAKAGTQAYSVSAVGLAPACEQQAQYHKKHLGPRFRGDDRGPALPASAAGDALDLGLDGGLHDGRQIVVQPLLQHGAQEFADHVFQRPVALGHQDRGGKRAER